MFIAAGGRSSGVALPLGCQFDRAFQAYNVGAQPKSCDDTVRGLCRDRVHAALVDIAHVHLDNGHA